MGTSSIHAFFGCAGYKSLHYRCLKDMSCAKCIKQSVQAGLPTPLEECGNADVFSQVEGEIDNKQLYFPQIELLEEIVRLYPNATFILTFRSMEKWYHSISNWPPTPLARSLRTRLRMARITGLPTGKGDMQQFSDFFCGHVDRVREIVPSHRLVEIDIEDNITNSRMSDIFDIDEECWGHSNVNTNLHPEVTKGKDLPWFSRRKTTIRGKNGVRRKMHPLAGLKRDPIDRLDSINVDQSQVNINNDEMIASVKALDPGIETWSESCQKLIAHENGYWHHHHDIQNNSLLLNNPNFQQSYLPEEMRWLKGTLPQSFATCTGGQFLMYRTITGHQCGCGVRGFAPSHSVWVHNQTNTIPSKDNQNYFSSSPTLRLAKQLANANATLCFSGDSIDYQIFSAFYNILKRLDRLHRIHNPGKYRLLTLTRSEINVTRKYLTPAGKRGEWFLHGQRPPDGNTCLFVFFDKFSLA